MFEPLEKEYLGDAVYMEDDGYHLVLTTSNGIHTTNRICIEPMLFDQLGTYIERFKKLRSGD